MELETIKMSRDVARIHFRQYRDAVAEHRKDRLAELHKRGQEAGAELGKVRIEKTRIQKEDESMLKVYKAILRGERVINLKTVLQKTGVDPKQHLPKLAIAQANAEFCWFDGNRHGQATFYWDQNAIWGYRNFQKKKIGLFRDIFPAETSDMEWRKRTNLSLYPVRSVVPTVPPSLRPKNLSDYHILWEAVWEKAPPVDPILLKRVDDDHFIIIAQWDLTTVEQSVLTSRF